VEAAARTAVNIPRLPLKRDCTASSDSDILEALDCGDLAALTLLDLSAGFDTVDYTVLIRRLEMAYGIHSTVLD